MAFPDVSEFRKLAVAFGFGDRLPPVPKDAKVLDLVPKDKE
jgi:hypothetical protein